MASKTSAPSSTRIPEKSGSGAYIGGVVVLALLIGGLVLWKSSGGPDAPTTPTVAQQAPPQEQPAPQFAPPPPPVIEEEEDAGTDAGQGTTGAVKAGTTGGGACANCGSGKPSGALKSALSSMAGSAKGCYDRALRNSAVSGKLMVSVQVGPTGSVCGASIASDTVGSPEVSSCVLGRFQGQQFPPPESGCVVVNIPINFEIKN